MQELHETLTALTARYRAELIAFCQQIVRTPSLPGEEGPVANLVHDEMARLGYDEVWIDEWGNVIGLLRGQSSGRSILFNGHMDHVDPGDAADWLYPPFGAEIHDGRLWGRATADMKGPLAAMIHAVGALAREKIRPAGDVYVAAVVQEEVSGLGSIKLAQTLRTDCAVVGEASSNQLARGHRGRVEPVITVRGRSVHASVPRQGVNPHAVLARFIQRLESLPLAHDETFGHSSVAPTLYLSDQSSGNVLPGEIRLHLDWRNIPGETAADVLAQLQPLLQSCLAEVEGSQGEVSLYSHELRTHTGQKETLPAVFPSFALAADDPWVLKGQQVLARTLARPVKVIVWPFATDGGHLMAAGIPTIGFGPAEAPTLHTVRENVPLDLLIEGMLGYMGLALELGKEKA
ncbi:MAG: M20/M25/M40 family metallo-hydrolase [Chloroflexota bacterium]